MAAMTVTNVPNNTKVVATGTAVSSSDTLTAGQVGRNGVLLRVTNGGGGSINVTVTDPGSTAAGNTVTASTQAVANGTSGYFRILPGNVSLTTGLATVTYSGTTSVTYEAVPAA